MNDNNKNTLPPINRSEFEALIFLGNKNKGGLINSLECHIEGKKSKLTEMLVVAMHRDKKLCAMLVEAILIYKSGLAEVITTNDN